MGRIYRALPLPADPSHSPLHYYGTSALGEDGRRRGRRDPAGGDPQTATDGSQDVDNLDAALLPVLHPDPGHLHLGVNFFDAGEDGCLAPAVTQRILRVKV